MAEGKGLKYQAIPERFVERIKSQYPADIVEPWLQSLDQLPAASVRLNPQKCKAVFEHSLPVLWCDSGRHLADRPLFAADPFYHGGVYYPQESSSMILAWVLEQLQFDEERIDALDVAAAPGGKTLILSDFLRHKGRVIANEMDSRRCSILEENISRWGCDNVIVTQGTSAQLKNLCQQFQLVLLDAPCSGEGMFRKDYHARAQWNEELVSSCARLQKNILNDISDLVAPEGFLVYSTCTFSDEENLHQLDRLCESGEYDNVLLQPPSNWGITLQTSKFSSALQCIPGRVRGEGLTMGVLRKKGLKLKQNIKPAGLFRELRSSEQKKLPIDAEDIFYNEKKDHYVCSKFRVDELNSISAAIPIRKSGIAMGHLAGDSFIPDHELAMAPRFKIHYPSFPVDEHQARRYLAGETWPSEFSAGWSRIEYESVTLGWIKSLGGRFNNYLPKPLRLRSRELRDWG
ncbi:MAG: methyltransferase RsmF C-terminal domain-like protein [Flavobacteriales bacterium]